MPVIGYAQSKGGACKTTTCIVSACEVARQGADKGVTVAIIDADPNQHTMQWSQKDGCPKNIKVISAMTEEAVLNAIEEEKQKSDFVFVDLEGVSSNAVTFAVSQADLVVIPCQPSENDANEAAKTIRMIKNSSRMLGREIPLSVIFCNTDAAIVTRTQKHYKSQFKKAGIHVFESEMIKREPFKLIITYGGSVSELDTGIKSDKAMIKKAENTAKSVTEELKIRIKSIIEKKGAIA